MNRKKLSWPHWRVDAAGIAAVAGLTLYAYFGLVCPAMTRHEQAKAQAVELVAEQAHLRDLERSLHSFTDRLGSTLNFIEASKFQLEPATNLNQRLARLTEIAGQNQLQVDSIESGATANFERYSTIAIRINGKGNYRNCTAMLHEVRRAMLDVGVTSVQMLSTAVNSDINASFAFELVWYAQPPPKATSR